MTVAFVVGAVTGLALFLLVFALIPRRDGLLRRVAAFDADGRARSWFVFVIQVATADARRTRDALRENLKSAGVATQVYFPAIHKQPYFRDLVSDSIQLPVTEHAADSCLALPFSTRLSETEIRFVADAVRAYFPTVTAQREEEVQVTTKASAD